MKQKKYILMLEADEHDRELSSNYFKAEGIPYIFLKYSSEVIPFLAERMAARESLPSLILLTLNSMPDNGFSVLTNLKGSEEFRQLPVVMLGENTQPGLVRQCYHAGANTFINKPFTDHLTDLKIKTFLRYWFEVAELCGRPYDELVSN